MIAESIVKTRPLHDGANVRKMLARVTVTILLCNVACTSAYVISKFSQVQIELRSASGDDKDMNVQVQFGQNSKQNTDSSQRNGQWGINLQLQETRETNETKKLRVFGNDELEQATQTTLEPTTPKPEIIRGYRRLGNKFYKLVKQPGTNWGDAREKCHGDGGGDLAVIHSEEEADFLLELFTEDPSSYDGYIWEAYVGASDRIVEGLFLTVEGVIMRDSGFNKWLPNEPNNGDNRRSSDEDCVTFHKRGAFNDVDCSRDMPYFCETHEDNLKTEEISGEQNESMSDSYF